MGHIEKLHSKLPMICEHTMKHQRALLLSDKYIILKAPSCYTITGYTTLIKMTSRRSGPDE